MRNRYKSIFIDLDDTLWDTYHNNKECLEELYTDYHWNQYYDTFEAFYAVYMPHNLGLWAMYRRHEIDRDTLIIERFRYILNPMGINDIETILAVNTDFLQRTTTRTKLIPGAIELLEYLRSGYRLFILSNGFREVQYKKLKNSGLAPYIERMILSEDVGIQKPHKDIFDFALKNTNSRRAESLMIGDSWEADIVGAYRSKINQIWLNPGQLPAEEFTPTYTVETLEEIKGIL